ncbi:hypothetical protein BsWGS_09794 [Bradybaena similaris]
MRTVQQILRNNTREDWLNRWAQGTTGPVVFKEMPQPKTNDTINGLCKNNQSLIVQFLILAVNACCALILLIIFHAMWSWLSSAYSRLYQVLPSISDTDVFLYHDAKRLSIISLNIPLSRFPSNILTV